MKEGQPHSSLLSFLEQGTVIFFHFNNFLPCKRNSNVFHLPGEWEEGGRKPLKTFNNSSTWGWAPELLLNPFMAEATADTRRGGGIRLGLWADGFLVVSHAPAWTQFRKDSLEKKSKAIHWHWFLSPKIINCKLKRRKENPERLEECSPGTMIVRRQGPAASRPELDADKLSSWNPRIGKSQHGPVSSFLLLVPDFCNLYFPLLYLSGAWRHTGSPRSIPYFICLVDTHSRFPGIP